MRAKEPTQNGTGAPLRQTQMVYDNFGRKISMNDPDMGAWSYQYDAAGSLLRQAANAGVTGSVRVLCFKYDALDRLTAKAGYFSNATCPGTFPTSGSNHLASYVYDTAANGKGQLHTVSWGPSPAKTGTLSPTTTWAG